MLQAPLDDSVHVLMLRDTRSIQTLSERLGTAKRVMIVGNGGIALELVEALQGYEVRQAGAPGSHDVCHANHELYFTKRSQETWLGLLRSPEINTAWRID